MAMIYAIWEWLISQEIVFQILINKRISGMQKYAVSNANKHPLEAIIY